MEKITAKEFFQAWLNTVTNRKTDMLKVWRNNKQLTAFIKGSKDSIMEEVGNKLGLMCYHADYYSLDSILYKPEDKTPDTLPNTYWFRDLRVAFEHENNFRGGLYQEVSHLLITNCDLRVLVTYPNDSSSNPKTQNEMKYLHKIIHGSRQGENIAAEESFLLIFGYETSFAWEAFIYKQTGWLNL
jgi:hypothetical protein